MLTPGQRSPTKYGVLAAVLLAAPASAQTTTLVSLDSGGVQGNGHSDASRISANGRYVVFESQASNLVPGDTNGAPDVFVRDLVAGTTERVSVATGGGQGNGSGADFYLSTPALSADGRYVAFESFASNLVAGDTNLFRDVFVRDRLAGTTERVSVDSGGVQGDLDSYAPALSADGRFVAFQSDATNLVAGDTNSTVDIFVRDRQLGTTVRVSLGPLGVQGNGASLSPAISADGLFVAFQTSATNFIVPDANGTNDIFVRDRLAGTTVCASVDPGGATGNGTSLKPALSADGRYVTFASQASNLVGGDANLAFDVFVRDLVGATTERVSLDDAGAEGNGQSGISYGPSISYDGRYVAFESQAFNLVLGDTNGSSDVFLHDRLLSTTERVSVDTSGAQGNNFSARSSLSSDGRFVAFETYATNLALGDANGFRDVLLRDRRTAITSFCFGDGIDMTHTSPCPCANWGSPGHGCAHSLDAAGALLEAGGSVAGDDVQLASSFEPVSSYTLFLQHDAPGDFVFHDGVLCAGGALIRLRGRPAVSGQASFPNPLWDSSITLSQRGGVFPGQGVRRYYAAWFRNASTSFCPPATANVSNGIYVDW